MARTFRRTGKHGYNRYEYADGWFEEFEHTWQFISKYKLEKTPSSVWIPHLGCITYAEFADNKDKLLKKLRNYYHADLRQFDGPPTSLRRSLNREFRNKNKRILFAAIQSEQDNFIPFKKNVGYYA